MQMRFFGERRLIRGVAENYKAMCARVAELFLRELVGTKRCELIFSKAENVTRPSLLEFDRREEKAAAQGRH